MSRLVARRDAWALGVVLVAGCVLRVALAYACPNMVWPDEIFQTLEPAHREVFGYGIVSWEYRDGIRSWLLPGFLMGPMYVGSWFSASSGAYVVTCAAALSAIALLPIVAIARFVRDELGVRASVVAAFVCAGWFELVYFGPKALGEVVGGHLFAFGAIAGARAVRRAKRGEVALGGTGMVAVALPIALAAMLRIQLAIAAGFALVFVCVQLARRERWIAVATAAATVAVAGLVDWVTWGYPFHSFVENIRINVIEGKSEHYGVAPAWTYFVVYARVWGIAGLAVVALAVIGARRVPLLGVCALLVVASHVPLAHKEYRFLYPATVLVLALAAIGTAEAVAWIERERSRRASIAAAACAIALWSGASAWRGLEFHESSTTIPRSWGSPSSHWEARRGGLLGMQRLGEDPDVCGVALVDYLWAFSGGYTYLHRDIPLYEGYDRAALPALAPYVNAVLTGPHGSAIDPFVRTECWKDACIWRRPGGCDVQRGYGFNAVLESRGQ